MIFRRLFRPLIDWFESLDAEYDAALLQRRAEFFAPGECDEPTDQVPVLMLGDDPIVTNPVVDERRLPHVKDER